MANVIATTVDGVQVHYELTGSGPGVVLIHGITDSSEDWGPIPERLAVDHTVLTLDLRGHGQSGDADDYSPIAMARDVAAAIAAAGLDTPLLIGHSLGGAVASVHAATDATRGVINIDQSLRFSDFGAQLGQLEHQLRGSGFHAALRAIFNSLDGPLLPDHLRMGLAANRERARQDVVLAIWDMVFTSSPEELDAIVPALGPAITVPYLAIHGSSPGDDYPAWLRASIPQAQVEHWEHHGHYPHLVDVERFLARVGEIEASAR